MSAGKECWWRRVTEKADYNGFIILTVYVIIKKNKGDCG